MNLQFKRCVLGQKPSLLSLLPSVRVGFVIFIFASIENFEFKSANKYAMATNREKQLQYNKSRNGNSDYSLKTNLELSTMYYGPLQ